jgi:hypothetical protein
VAGEDRQGRHNLRTRGHRHRSTATRRSPASSGRRAASGW